MTSKLIYFGTLERLKIYAGILILYLVFLLVNVFSGPLLEVDILGSDIDLSSVPVLGMALTSLVLTELILFVRDFYSPTAYLLFSLPAKGSAVVGSRFALFMQNIVLLIVLDLPFRVPMIRAILSGIPDAIGHEMILPTASEMLWPGVVSIITGILVLTLVPLITYFLISTAKNVFDLSSNWLIVYVAGGFSLIFLLGLLVGDFMPQLIDVHYHDIRSYTIKINYVLLLPLGLLNIFFFWITSWILDHKLNI